MPARAMAAMAACMILFMLSLVLWDVGHATRDKVDLQNAADSAAYSKAAVNARSMNMLAFTNIAKRTVVGLHNTYWGMFIAYAGWTAGECAECCSCGLPVPCCRLCPCPNCASNVATLIREALGDWSEFAGFALFPIPTPAGKSGDVFGSELDALDKYQHYIKDITPWWGWAEQLLRGIRNGATVTVSWPPPSDPLASMSNTVQDVLTLPFMPSNWTLYKTTTTDSLPVSIDHSGSVQNLLDKFMPTPVATIADMVVGSLDIVESRGDGGSKGPYEVSDLVSDIREVFYNLEVCSPGMPGMSPATLGSITEVGANVFHHRNRSNTMGLAGIGPCSGPSSWQLLTAGTAMATTLCPISAVLPQFRESMGPAFLWGTESVATGVSGSDTLPNSFGAMQSRSNLIFAYKQAPKYQNGLRNNFGFLENDYYDRGQADQQYIDKPVLKASGQWSLARSEIVHTHKAADPESSQFIDLGGLTQGVHNTWMWHTGWTAKLRPVAFDGVTLSSGSHLALFILASILISLVGVRVAAYVSSSDVEVGIEKRGS